MTSRPASRFDGVAPLVYWLLLVGGFLAAHRVLEHTEGTRGGALWLGALIGTALGQIAAWKRLPLWFVGMLLPVVTVAAVWLAVVLTVSDMHSRDPFKDVEIGLMAFVPAVLCGWASLSERGGLAALWFPSSLWMVAILDGADAGSFGSAENAALLGVLAALFVAFLYAREGRRVALWRSHAEPRLSVARPAAVLRRSPARAVAQAAWVATTTAATLALTTWVAPHLWQTEKAEASAVAAAQAHRRDPQLSRGEPCCPEVPAVEVESHRLREYLPLLAAHEDEAHEAPHDACVACHDGVPGGGPGAEVSSVADAGGGGAGPGTPAGEAAGGTASLTQAAASAPPALPPVVASPPSLPPVAPVVEPPGVWHLEPPHIAAKPRLVPARTVVARPAETRPVAWLLALVASALLVQLALRPLRRAVTVHHLREPLWREPVDQRVSNLWQLVLVGLRDAGFHAVAGEPPHELARRVAVPGAETCARVLDRTRHGARLDAGDLDAMRDAARSVYRASRRRGGLLARVLSWLRWPLV